VSPNTLFGGVEALVESQDWWLRDQASLVVGFDNWMSAGNGDMNAPNSRLNGNGNVNKTSPELDPMAGIGAGFYMPTNMNRDAFGDDNWNYS
jgi:hypothetical protein